MDPARSARVLVSAYWKRLRAYIRPRVEGRDPRALMEFALPPLEQVIGLEGSAPYQVRKEPVYRSAINESSAI